MFIMMATGGLLVNRPGWPRGPQVEHHPTALTAALALDRISNGTSRIFWGWVSDRIGRETTMSIAFILQAGCLLSVLFLGRRSGALFTVCLILVFFTFGEVFSLFPSTIGDYFGARHATSNYSFLYTAKRVASIIGGGLSALLFERFGSWSAAFYGSAVLALLSGIVALGLRAAVLPKRPTAVVPAMVHQNFCPSDRRRPPSYYKGLMPSKCPAGVQVCLRSCHK